MKSLRFYAFFLLLPCLLLDALQGLAVDIPKGTFYFDNSRTRYPTVKFTYGTNDPAVSYIVQMTDEGDNIWSITFDEAVPNMYRYFFSGTSMEVGTWQMSFYDLKEYVSNLDFDGLLSRNAIVDELRKVPGVEMVRIDQLLTRYAQNTWHEFGEQEQAESGYWNVPDANITVVYERYTRGTLL